MQPDQVYKLLIETGSLLEGHFLLSSGQHSDKFIQCAKVLSYPQHANALGQALANQVRSLQPTKILAPAMGGLIIGHEVARALMIPMVFCERDHLGKMRLRRGLEINEDDRVVIVEDVVTTGVSSWETSLLAGSDKLVGFASMVSRHASKNPFKPYPYFTLLQLKVEQYPNDACKICDNGEIALVKPGSRV